MVDNIKNKQFPPAVIAANKSCARNVIETTNKSHFIARTTQRVQEKRMYAGTSRRARLTIHTLPLNFTLQPKKNNECIMMEQVSYH